MVRVSVDRKGIWKCFIIQFDPKAATTTKQSHKAKFIVAHGQLCWCKIKTRENLQLISLLRWTGNDDFFWGKGLFLLIEYSSCFFEIFQSSSMICYPSMRNESFRLKLSSFFFQSETSEKNTTSWRRRRRRKRCVDLSSLGSMLFCF